jgi:hypothetical protein
MSLKTLAAAVCPAAAGFSDSGNPGSHPEVYDRLKDFL